MEVYTLIREILLELIMLGLFIWIISNALISFTDLVIKFKEVFPRKHIDPLEEEIYAPIDDYDDGFIEDERNYDERIRAIKAEILKPEIITDEQEVEQERM